MHKADLSLASQENKISKYHGLSIFGATLDEFISKRKAGRFEIDITTLPQRQSKLPHGLEPFVFASAATTATTSAAIVADTDATGLEASEEPQSKKSHIEDAGTSGASEDM